MNENTLRLIFFLGIFSFCALFEHIFPRRSLQYSKIIRWRSNLGISLFNSILLRILFPYSLFEIALFCEEKSIGLFNFFSTHFYLKIFLSLIFLDFIIYLQHIAFHKIPLLWRLHRMHHTDLDLDVSSGSRFHTFEIFISQIIKIASIFILGIPPLAIILFEILLSSLSLFNHSNLFIPLKMDSLLRKFIVTPDMHRIHHSILKEETNSNFGFNLSIWDKLFNTYHPNPLKGQTNMTLGIENFRNTNNLYFHSLLLQPFIKSNE